MLNLPDGVRIDDHGKIGETEPAHCGGFVLTGTPNAGDTGAAQESAVATPLATR